VKLSLQEHLERGLADFEPGFETLRVMTSTAKWRASSATQKAIRRGDVGTAMRFAQALHKFEPDYWWRRLPLIALEDVGHANRSAVAMTLWAARHARWRREHGDDRVLAFLVRELASGTKCRAAADLLFAPRTRAVVYRYRHGELPRDDWRPDPLVTFIERVGQGVHGGMAGAFAALAPLVDLGPTTVEREEPIDLGKIGPWPSYCFDQYVSDGRRSFAYFLRACAPLTRLFFEVGVPTNKWTEALGGLVFRVEGQQCDRRLRFPGSAQAQAEATAGGSRAVLGSRLEEALAVVRANLPLLHRARVAVLGGTSPRSPVNPPANPDPGAPQPLTSPRARRTAGPSGKGSIKGQRNDSGINATASAPEPASERASCASACAVESPMKRIALYSRVSTQDQHPEAQIAELREYATRRGAAAVEFVDVASGAKADRPALKALLGAVHRREVDAVVCVKLDRMARSVKHLCELAHDFEARGVALIATGQSIDTSTSAGRFLFHTLAAVAELERDLIRERTRSGLAAARKRGRHPGRPRKLNTETLARARRLRESGRSIREIAGLIGASKSAVARELARVGAS
jgi:DNA invertase Pin-like site-specific DNA recombinase